MENVITITEAFKNSEFNNILHYYIEGDNHKLFFCIATPKGQILSTEIPHPFITIDEFFELVRGRNEKAIKDKIEYLTEQLTNIPLEIAQLQKDLLNVKTADELKETFKRMCQ